MKFVFGACMVSVACCLAQTDKKPDREFNKTEINLPMKDGIKLATDIYLPEGKNDNLSAIIVRTPYGKDGSRAGAEEFVKNGIAVIVQDCRGKYKSEDEFYPFNDERADGLTTVNWIRKQPWSNGKVGGWGSSYVGYTQWAISDALDVFSPDLTTGNIYDLVYPDGLFSLQTAFNWGLAMAGKGLDPVAPDKQMAGMLILPLSVADDSTTRDLSYINHWLAHEKPDAYWKGMNFRGAKKAPVISAAGWYDRFLKAQIQDFQALSRNAKLDNRMIIGPWSHQPQPDDIKYGGREKTGNRSDAIRDYLISHLENSHLTSLPAPFKDKKYNLFIMERNEYFGSDTWPPAETKTTPYYIGPANYIGPKRYREEGNLEYLYDPAHPYPSLGGTGNLGAVEQKGNIDREDQVTFATETLGKPLILLGPVSASLWVSSSAPCTDFMVCLQDVFPDGKIYNIQQGGAEVQIDGKNPEKKEISVWATGYQLGIGHKLRVVITSSWFPRYNRSLNGCAPLLSAKEVMKARQKIYYGGATPSYINLPVIEIGN